MWAYRDGQQVASIDVVTGTQSTHNDTPKGVFYVMYKQTKTTLRGSRADGAAYASPVVVVFMMQIGGKIGQTQLILKKVL